MNDLAKFLATLFLLICAVSISVLTMIYGWGLHPKNWYVIIGLGVFGAAFLQWLMGRLKKEDER